MKHFDLRLPIELFMKIRKEAEKDKRSINKMIVYILEQYFKKGKQ